MCFLALIILTRLLPVILNYPPGYKEASKVIASSIFLRQFLSVTIGSVLVNLILMKVLKVLYNWKDAVNNSDYEKIKLIREKCLSAPYRIYSIQILIPATVLFIMLFVFTLTNKSTIYFRIMFLVFSLVSLFSVFTYILSNRIFKQVLVETFDNHGLQGIRFGLKSKIFIQIVPIFVSTVLLTSMVGYSRLIEEKGNIYSQLFMSKLDYSLQDINSVISYDSIKKKLSEIDYSESNFSTFLITTDNKVITSDQEDLSKINLYYINKPTPNLQGRFYDVTCETQGVFRKIPAGNNNVIVGIKFKVASPKTVNYFIGCFMALLLLCIIVLYYFAKSITSDISVVAANLSKIAEGDKVNLDKKIPIASNDEIGELIVAFNKIQELTKANIKSINEQQAMILEKERLASLGQMIGGIAHNLNSPIMTIACLIDTLNNLANEYKNSIGDRDVTNEDHIEIANEILDCINKISPQCSYMSKIISNVKLQAVKLNESSTESFTIDELIKTLNIKLNHNMPENSLIIPQIQVEKHLKIQGDINSLIQVLDNLLQNACESYQDDYGSVDFIVQKDNNNIKFIIKDNGKGIPVEVKSKIFKEMITTKGKNGTGIGLYMSYSTIKGRFGGDIWFESDGDKGTAFYITVPYVS
ncbi:putative sensor with HAMP domain containing protein [Pseudobacteroides cellulosolvens ATCC 35603 = DSM 2933]|uniref:histidine kinase n=1 Tax=Pseudobacteroides cellulosolvens ATCC 35603 = DSM 2933 TaxID=398512 RepID=A0A0L6JNF1_9FIRM|nr:putative sensor with HAMP domain containing protein [Pseudobacteroides cellulosolvens ATCC 35603 = DSM 2933]